MGSTVLRESSGKYAHSAEGRNLVNLRSDINFHRYIALFQRAGYIIELQKTRITCDIQKSEIPLEYARRWVRNDHVAEAP